MTPQSEPQTTRHLICCATHADMHRQARALLASTATRSTSPRWSTATTTLTAQDGVEYRFVIMTDPVTVIQRRLAGQVFESVDGLDAVPAILCAFILSRVRPLLAEAAVSEKGQLQL